MKLLIVESPGKVKKIQSFLGPEWKVAASVGHVRDMPVKRMGVAAPDFAIFRMLAKSFGYSNTICSDIIMSY
jgi:DNA topoisomerase IA